MTGVATIATDTAGSRAAHGVAARALLVASVVLAGLSLPPAARAEEGIVGRKDCLVMPVVLSHPSRVLMREPFALSLRVAAHCTHKVSPLHLAIVVAIGGGLDAKDRRDLARRLDSMAAELEALPEPRLRVGVAVPGAARELFCPIEGDLRRAATCLRRADAVQGYREGGLTAAVAAGVRLFGRTSEPWEDETEPREILLLLDAPGDEDEESGVAGRTENGRSDRDCAQAELAAGLLRRRGVLRIVMRATHGSRAITWAWSCPYHLATTARYAAVQPVALSRALYQMRAGPTVTGRSLRRMDLRLTTSEWIDVLSVFGAERLPPTTSGAVNLRVEGVDGAGSEITVVMRARIPGRHAAAQPLALQWVEPGGLRGERTEPTGAAGNGTVLVLGARHLPTAPPRLPGQGQGQGQGSVRER
jgi:hypothetical protein